MISYEEFCSNCGRLEERIAAAASACGRNPAEIKILPVTKTHPLDAAEYAARRGFCAVGENRVQEAAEKIAAAAKSESPAKNIGWELIGHLQSNKARLAAELFSRVQSADSVKLLSKLDAESRALSKTLRVLLQVNAGSDPAKFGADIEAAPAMFEAALGMKNLKVDGLMTIAPLDANLDTASRCFANLRNLRDTLAQSFRVPLPELSMGMSGDLERAVAEGSTMIRVGTFLFGERIYPQA